MRLEALLLHAGFFFWDDSVWYIFTALFSFHCSLHSVMFRMDRFIFSFASHHTLLNQPSLPQQIRSSKAQTTSLQISSSKIQPRNLRPLLILQSYPLGPYSTKYTGWDTQFSYLVLQYSQPPCNRRRKSQRTGSGILFYSTVRLGRSFRVRKILYFFTFAVPFDFLQIYFLYCRLLGFYYFGFFNDFWGNLCGTLEASL